MGIMAGNMGLRLTTYSVDFMQKWEDFHSSNCFNADNGALHIHLLLVLQDELPLSKSAISDLKNRFRRVGGNIQHYDRFVAWAKLTLGQRRLFKHIRILRRGMAFCIDAWVAKIYYSPGDLSASYLCLHGVKNRLGISKKYGPNCTDRAERCESTLHQCALKKTITDAKLIQQMRHWRGD